MSTRKPVSSPPARKFPEPVQALIEARHQDPFRIARTSCPRGWRGGSRLSAASRAGAGRRWRARPDPTRGDGSVRVGGGCQPSPANGTGLSGSTGAGRPIASTTPIVSRPSCRISICTFSARADIGTPIASWVRTCVPSRESAESSSPSGRPNATRVSVVGDFNAWDGRAYPMRSRGGSGVWELFMPGPGGRRPLQVRAARWGGERPCQDRPLRQCLPGAARYGRSDLRRGLVHLGRFGMDGSTGEVPTGGGARCRSTRCISVPGNATPMVAFWATGNWRRA